jgi:HK97 gp10 family phage protein
MTAAFADLTNLSARFGAASGQSFATAAEKLVHSYGQQIAQVAQTMAPVRTGALRDSITVSYPAALTAVIGPHQPYAAYMEYGTASRGEFGGAVYTIRPKKPGGVLVFKVGGRTVYAKMVKHPGVPPHPYMRPAFERVITPFGQALGELGSSYVNYGPNQPASRPTQAAA